MPRIGRYVSTNPKIDATEVREHLLWLQSKGVGIHKVAAESGIGPTQIFRIRAGKAPVVLAQTALKILAVGTHRFDPAEIEYNGSGQRARNWYHRLHPEPARDEEAQDP